MGKPGFVRVTANRDDSERPAASALGIQGMIRRVEELEAEIGMRCGKSYPHAAHNWQMSATGWCACDGRESTPIYDSLVNARSSQF